MRRTVGLQILRVLACAGVFLCHLGAQMEVDGTLEKFMDFGAMGVYLFFILSGYFGFHSKELENENKVKGCLKYWTKRAFKILPLYSINACLNSSFAITSKWFVGSSSTKILEGRLISLQSLTFACSPPERTLTLLSIWSVVRPHFAKAERASYCVNPGNSFQISSRHVVSISAGVSCSK